jgi:N-acetylglucosaminyldiphosphoundecaprenol N-acetyl-beta-D-mannosaminyltransferase
MSACILGTRVDPTSYEAAITKVVGWARQHESRYLCVANVHMTMEAYDSPGFRSVINHADVVTPDGMPLVWMMRWLGYPQQERVYGPELTLRLLETVAQEGLPIGFYGSKPDGLQALITKAGERFPGLQVVYANSPPFRPLTSEEDQRVVEEINTSKARILFVGLGCPKQERWMADHKGKVRAVMLGVGAAFDFLAGKVRQAPIWKQSLGLEWLFRFWMEPKRLLGRYLYHNPRFIALAIMQLSGLQTFNMQ